jgi:hypothetical protein
VEIDTADLGQRAERLAADLIAPLVTGQTIRLQRPFGLRLCGAIGPHREIVNVELRHDVAQARIEAARQLLPIDAIPDLSASEWSLAAALNDLLQVGNHELSSFASRGRHTELCHHVYAVTTQLAPVSSLGDALVRHATFGRVCQIRRVDTRVAWWTGSERFRGQQPDGRLLAWPALRRVTTSRTEVGLDSLTRDLAYVDVQPYAAALGAWLAASPLTDIANAARSFPRFVWTPASVAIIATRDGHNLALRAVKHHDVATFPHALQTAAEHLTGAPQKMVHSFISEVTSAIRLWHRPDSPQVLSP